MTTISEIEDRLNALAFSGRSYSGLTREEVTEAYAAAVMNFNASCAADAAYLIERVQELQSAIIAAATELSDAAIDVAESYAADDEEVTEIRIRIGDPVDKLVSIAWGAEIQEEEATK